MYRTSFVALGLVLVGLATARPVPASGQAAGGWTTILSGSSLDGWTAIGDAKWRIVDGSVQPEGESGFLVANGTYGDFQLKVEFWASDDANSGVFIRCSDPKEVTAASAYEVNIFDKRPDQAYRTGAIVNVAKPASIVNAGGRWNTYEITARGPKMTVTLNGTRTVDVEHSGHARGCIALQAGAGTVKFRSVQVRML